MPSFEEESWCLRFCNSIGAVLILNSASIMPLIPAAGLQATVYAVAEKAADLIKARA